MAQGILLTLRLSLTGVLGLLIPGIPGAAPNAYQVELIFFAPRTLTLEPTTANQRAANQDMPSFLSGAIDLQNPSLPITQVKPAERKLSELAGHLKRSSQYQVIGHVAWRQPALGGSQALPVRIDAGQATTSVQVAGTVKLTAGSGFTLNAALVLRQAQGDEMHTVPIHAQRSMHSNRLHYLDHPLLGILVEVFTVED